MPSTPNNPCCPPTRCPVSAPSNLPPKGKMSTVPNPLTSKLFRYYKTECGELTRVAVVMFSDILGMESGRHFSIADDLAKENGCTVIIPDLLGKDMATFDIINSPALMELIGRHPIDGIQKDLDFCYETLLPKSHFDKIVIVAFCWGSWICFNEGSRMKDNRLRGGVNFHPSLQVESIFGSTDIALVQSNKIPMVICPCKDDQQNMKPGKDCIVNAYPNFSFPNEQHGFVTQGDICIESVKADILTAKKIFQAFFHLITLV